MNLQQSHEERRIATILLDYWNQQRGERAFPTEHDIDPDALKDVWNNCFLLQARDIERRDDFNYSFLGTNIIRAYRGSAMQPDDSGMVGPNAAQLSNSFAVVLENKSPIEEDGEFLALDGTRVQYRQCLLPLGEENGRITAVFGGLSLRFVDDPQ